MKQRWIKDEIYGYNIVIFYDTNNEEFHKYLLQFDRNFKYKESTAAFVKFIDGKDNEHRALYIPDTGMEQDIIDHEILHLCFANFRDCGIIISLDSEEAFTYYYQYLKRKIYKALTGIPGKKKKRSNPGKNKRKP